TSGDEGLTRCLYELLLPCADHVVTFGAGGAVLGCTHHWLGLLAGAFADVQLAVDHLSEAETISTRIGAPYWRAQAQVDLASVLCRRGNEADASSARHLVREARSVAEPRGFGRLLASTA
ncbi:MAG: hypothetical protein QOF28_2976, partial [Actinomycetota bacterium]|nr:hypothetical protein [Actinomycetota bacterium]